MSDINRDIDAYADEYLKPSFEDYQVQFRRKKILEIIDSVKPKRILEIGCGMEPIFKYLNLDEYQRVVTVEPSKVFFENAVNCRDGNEKVCCVNAFFEEYAAKVEEEFDFILCSSLIFELDNPGRMLKAIADVCRKSTKSKTVVHINAPNANSIHRLLAKEMG